MNKLPFEKRVQALNMLVEGSSMRSISRVLGIDMSAVTKLLVDAGEACMAYHDETIRNVPARHVQCDEIWSFCYAKQKNMERARGVVDSAGDVWTWTAIDSDTKLIVSWRVGSRDSGDALEFLDDLHKRVADRIQLSTDGYGAYVVAVEDAFGSDVDYAQIIKLYGRSPDEEAQRRYSPAQCLATRRVPIYGRPNMDELSTSYVERHNLTMRMSMRRFTRLTNAFSKKLQNHIHALALYFVWYNFVRVHKTLKATPAMAAGLAEYPRDMGWVVELIDARAPAPKKRGPYKKRAASPS